MILSAENRDARCMVGRPDSRRAGPASERSRLATDSARSGTERRTAFRASRTTSAYVPIGRVWRLSSADVLCARSVRFALAQIGRSVSGLDCEEVPGSGNAFEVVFAAVVEFDA
jgi:hypothetical protein